MGIVPISSFIPVTVTRSNQTALEPLPMERAENSAKAGDETYTPSGSSEGELEDEAGEEESGDEKPGDECIEAAADETIDDPLPQVSSPEDESLALGGVNFFA